MVGRGVIAEVMIKTSTPIMYTRKSRFAHTYKLLIFIEILVSSLFPSNIHTRANTEHRFMLLLGQLH